MIIKLGTMELIQKAKIAEAKNDFRNADRFTKLAEHILSCALQFAQKFSTAELATLKPQDNKAYTGEQRDVSRIATQATVAWVEYVGSLFSRLPQASGKDAYAIAEYAKDIQNKILQQSALSHDLMEKSIKENQPFNLNRRVSPIANPSMTTNLGASMAYRGGIPGAFKGIGGNAVKGVTAPLQQAGLGAKQTWQQAYGLAKMPFGGKYPTYDVGRPIAGPSYENPAMVGKQSLISNNYAQNLPYRVDINQILGTGKGEFATMRADAAMRKHPAMKDPAMNEKGFKAMEACWIEYFYKYLPKYGINLGQATGDGGLPSTFATSLKRNLVAGAVATAPGAKEATPTAQEVNPSGYRLPPMPKIVSLKQNIQAKENIGAEEKFYKQIFVEVERRLSGKDGDSGMTLKGVVRKGALQYAAGQNIQARSSAETAGAVGGAALGVGGYLAGQEAAGTLLSPLSSPLTRGIAPGLPGKTY